MFGVGVGVSIGVGVGVGIGIGLVTSERRQSLVQSPTCGGVCFL